MKKLKLFFFLFLVHSHYGGMEIDKIMAIFIVNPKQYAFVNFYYDLRFTNSLLRQ